MSRFILFIAITLSFNSHSQLNIEQLTDSIYVYSTYKEYDGNLVSSNSLYYLTADGIVMIDTPWDSAQLPKLLDSMRIKHNASPVFCISTHFHADRTAGLDYLDSIGVKTYSSELTKELCKERGEEQAENTFENDTTFVIGGKRILTFFPGAGHSPDNIVVLLNDENILFGGCFIKSYKAQSLGYTGDANISSWHKGIKNINGQFKWVDVVIPGHGPWKKTKSIKQTKKLLSKAIRFNRRAWRKINVTF